MEYLKNYLDKDINTKFIQSKKTAVIGGSQCYCQSMNLKDSGGIVLEPRSGGKSNLHLYVELRKNPSLVGNFNNQ